MKTVYVNPERCIGCKQCEFACKVEHSRSKDPVGALWEQPLSRARVHPEPGPLRDTSFPTRCRHCSPAPCQQVCPSGAMARDPDHDLVLVDARKCIACAMCAMVCPFGAVTYHPCNELTPVKVSAIKCDGCQRRIDAGRVPACAEACKTGALVFGELNELMKVGRLRVAGQALAAAATASSMTAQRSDVVGQWRAWGSDSTVVSDRLRTDTTR
jgi:anaerobic carbon-monoxide dehydrogenase iron sulfur subunit